MSRRPPIRWSWVCFGVGACLLGAHTLMLMPIGPHLGFWRFVGGPCLLIGTPLLLSGLGVIVVGMAREIHAAEAHRVSARRNTREAIIEARQPGSKSGVLSEATDDNAGMLAHVQSGQLSEQDP